MRAAASATAEFSEQIFTKNLQLFCSSLKGLWYMWQMNMGTGLQIPSRTKREKRKRLGAANV